MFVMNRMKRSLEDRELKTKKLGSKATLTYLRKGPTQAADIVGAPPEPYLEALLEGTQPGFTVTVRTHDDALPKQLLKHGAKVWVGPPPDAGKEYALSAFQEDGTLNIQQRDAEPERKYWEAGGSKARHNLNLGDFAPFDAHSVETSMSALSPKRRNALERRLNMSPRALVRTFSLLMTLSYALPVVGLMLCFTGLGFSIWSLTQDRSFLVPTVVTAVGVLAILVTHRYVNRRIDALVGTDPGP